MARKRLKEYVIILLPDGGKTKGRVTKRINGCDVLMTQILTEGDIPQTQIIGTDGSVVYQVPSWRVTEIYISPSAKSQDALPTPLSLVSPA